MDSQTYINQAVLRIYELNEACQRVTQSREYNDSMGMEFARLIEREIIRIQDDLASYRLSVTGDSEKRYLEVLEVQNEG